MRAHILPLRRIGTEVGERITQFIGIVCSEIFPADAVDPLLVMTVFIGYGERQNRDPPVSELPQGGEDFPVMRIVIEVDRIPAHGMSGRRLQAMIGICSECR